MQWVIIKGQPYEYKHLNTFGSIEFDYTRVHYSYSNLDYKKYSFVNNSVKK